MGDLDWLQNWYANQCDGDWEHSNGLRIETLDNPGWSVRIDRKDTEIAERPLALHKVERSDLDWLHCWVTEDYFAAACGPKNLGEVIAFFRAWVELPPALS